MIPEIVKFVCPKCRYSEIKELSCVTPRICECPKCKESMKHKRLQDFSMLERVLYEITKPILGIKKE